MKELVMLTGESDWKHKRWTKLFLVTNPNNLKQTLKHAIQDYLLTEKGNHAIQQTNHNFNWGDAMHYVPETTWNTFGIKTVQEGEDVDFSSSSTLTVNQDEVLIPTEYYELDYKYDEM